MLKIVIMIVLGLILLVWGGELLIRGATTLAKRFGISPLVIGLTVVAMGTSAPEFMVCALAGWQGQADITLGNVVGSNSFNILFILGVSAMVAPLRITAQLIEFDIPIMIGSTLLAWNFAANGRIEFHECLVLVTGLLFYILFLFQQGKGVEVEGLEKETDQTTSEQPSSPPSPTWAFLQLLGGLILLVVGAKFLVDGSVELARSFGVSELLIGLTIVAGGTSLPELVTSVLATYKGERDIAVGNVVGSCIFNLLGVLGGAGAIAFGVPVSAQPLAFDIPVMAAVTFACLPIFISHGEISRWEGCLFLFYYVAYTYYLVLINIKSPFGDVFAGWILNLAIPCTIILLTVTWIREAKFEKAENSSQPTTIQGD